MASMPLFSPPASSTSGSLTPRPTPQNESAFSLFSTQSTTPSRPQVFRTNSQKLAIASTGRAKSIIQSIRKSATDEEEIADDNGWSAISTNHKRRSYSRSYSSNFEEIASFREGEGGSGGADSIRSKYSTTLPETEISNKKSDRLRFQKNLVKCIIAYAIASLFTYYLPFCDFLGFPFDADGPVRNAHVVATIAVYFNPAKSIGSMIEANFFAMIALIYSLFICVGSMAMTIYLDRIGGIGADVAHLLVVIIWIGGGLGFLNYWKARLNRSSLITTGSLVSVIVCVIATKEGALIETFPEDVIQQMAIIVFVGICISNVICVLIWPITARYQLKHDLHKTLGSFSTLLEMLIATFLQESDFHSSSSLKSAVSIHKATFTTLRSSLGHAFYEGVSGYDRVVESMSALAQDLTGLRASCLREEEDSSVVFEVFHEKVATSMRDLLSCSTDTFSVLQRAILSSGSASLEPLFEAKSRLESQASVFKSVQSTTIRSIYRKAPFTNYNATAYPEEPETGFFRAYYFGVNLSKFVEELVELLDIVLELKRAEQKRRNSSLLRKIFTSNTRRPSRNTSSSSSTSPFPIFNSHSKQHQHSLSWTQKIKRRIWSSFISPNVRFAIKSGIGAAALAAPAFVESTRSTWLDFRGEWALVSYMIIMTPTIGGTNKLGYSRIFGTLLGAGTAVIAYLLSDGDPVMLFCIGIIVSIYPFSLILSPATASNGRFLLLTYNLTALYTYNLREVIIPLTSPIDDADVVSVAFHRSVSVIVGVVWAVFISRGLFPYAARRELRKNLAIWFQNSSYLYERMIRTYSLPKAIAINMKNSSNEMSPLITSIPPIDEFLAMEIWLQNELNTLSSLLSATANEYRLKGPYPISTYRLVLSSCQTLLDILTSMRSLSNDSDLKWIQEVREDFVVEVQQERREMVGNVLLFFSVLSSGVSTGSILCSYLPPARQAQERLMTRLLSLPVVTGRVVKGGADSLLYLAYASTMSDLILELETIGSIFQELYGVSAADFESYFV